MFNKEGGLQFLHQTVLVVDRLLLACPSPQVHDRLNMDVLVASVCFLRAAQLTRDERDRDQLATCLHVALQLPPAVDLKETARDVRAVSLSLSLSLCLCLSVSVSLWFFI